MEFIVHLQVNWPTDGDPAELARLTEAEHERAVELADGGHPQAALAHPRAARQLGPLGGTEPHGAARRADLAAVLPVAGRGGPCGRRSSQRPAQLGGEADEDADR